MPLRCFPLRITLFTNTLLFTFVYDRKNENHWSLLITHYSEYKHLAIPNSTQCQNHCETGVLVNSVMRQNFETEKI